MKKIRVKVSNGKVLRADGDYSKKDYTDLRYFYAFHDDMDIVYGPDKNIRQMVGGTPISAIKDYRKCGSCVVFKRKGYAVNGTFFYLGKPFGYLMVNSKMVANYAPKPNWSDFMITKDRKISIGQLNPKDTSNILHSIPGSPRLLSNNVNVTEQSIKFENTALDIYKSGPTKDSKGYGRRPRTALGITKDNMILVVVVDGDSKYDTGLSLPELAEVMKYLGAVDAVNLDGGGSSTMVELKKSRFQRMTLEEYIQFLDEYTLTRKITAAHMHHTWKPRHSDFRGLPTIEAMWRFHTGTNKWSDIAQHATIDPEGYIWTGRDLNIAPASATGHNGDSKSGPFMFEIIGNFDIGEDSFQGRQRDSAIGLVRYWIRKNANFLLHNQMTNQKSCPGTSINYNDFVKLVNSDIWVPEQPGKVLPIDTPEWKLEGVQYLLEKGYLTDPKWLEKVDEPMPLWAQALIMKRMEVVE